MAPRLATNVDPDICKVVPSIAKGDGVDPEVPRKATAGGAPQRTGDLIHEGPVGQCGLNSATVPAGAVPDIAGPAGLKDLTLASWRSRDRAARGRFLRHVESITPAAPVRGESWC
ncbi:hypothetical protein GCM10009793_08750 [Brachybacterium phenoliresistens]